MPILKIRQQSALLHDYLRVQFDDLLILSWLAPYCPHDAAFESSFWRIKFVIYPYIFKKDHRYVIDQQTHSKQTADNWQKDVKGQGQTSHLVWFQEKFTRTGTLFVTVILQWNVSLFSQQFLKLSSYLMCGFDLLRTSERIRWFDNVPLTLNECSSFTGII